MAIEVKHATQATGTDAGNGEIAKAQWNEGHTLNLATGKLVGRSTAGAGAAEEISIGNGLALSAGVLTAVETVYAITDGASVDINPANGGIQTWTLGANRTPTAASFASGQSVALMIADGTAFAVTWTTMGVVWVGGTAPSLPTTGYGVIELWKVGSTIYGAYVGAVA
jgi:hypothetical protein